jgi:hypothetical protein
MRYYGRVDSTFWTSADTKTLSDDAKLLAVYLQSCEHGTMAGVCRLTDGYVSDDLDWQPERVAKGFGELSRKGFAIRCTTTDWVWVINFLDGVAYNPNQWKAARKIAAAVPVKCSWRAAFQQRFGEAAGDIPKGPQTVQELLPSVAVPVPVPVSPTEERTVRVSGSDAREPHPTTQHVADIAAAPGQQPKRPAPMQLAAAVASKALNRVNEYSKKAVSQWTLKDIEDNKRETAAKSNAN